VPKNKLSRPRYIATIRGRGYQLVPGPVSLADSGWRSKVENRLRNVFNTIRVRRNRRIGVVIVAILILAAVSLDGFGVTAGFWG
jgi:hypothetical protein